MADQLMLVWWEVGRKEKKKSQMQFIYHLEA